MRIIIPRAMGRILLASMLVLTAAAVTGAGQSKPVAVDSNHIAIRGYDPVAYFTDGRAIKGTSEFEYVFADAKWQFASAAHREMFVADPEHYMPQYGGFCAGGTVFGALAPADPQAWMIVNGKLYMLASKKALNEWKASSAENIRQANAQWTAMQQRQSPQHQ